MESREELSDKSSVHFPEDLLLQILVRLPARSIFKFKCVSRSWLDSISNPSFYHNYISRSCGLSSPFALVFQCGRYKGIRFSAPGGGASCPQFRLDRVPCSMLEATCHDLVLCRSYCHESTSCVANPFTGQSVALPSHSARECHNPQGLVVHVGYGSVNYNVVRIVKSNEDGNELCDARRILTFEIFCSQEGEWRDFEVKNGIGKVEIDARPCIVYEGILHWICNKMTSLLAYDPCSSPNRCRLIGIPNGAHCVNEMNAILGVSMEKLCYFETNGVSIHNRMLFGWKFWIMKDYGNGEWCLARKGEERSFESTSVVCTVLFGHSPVFPVALHPCNDGIVYFRCEDYILTFNVEKGWFEDEFFVLSTRGLNSKTEVFSFPMLFCASPLSPQWDGRLAR